MTTDPPTYTLAQRIGLAVFTVAVAATAGIIVLGLTGTPWPKWLLALTTIL